MITKTQKAEIYEKMTVTWQEAKSLVFFNYEKMNNVSLTEFRKLINKSGCHAFVTKNTLYIKSAQNAGIEVDAKAIETIFTGMTGAVYSTEDPIEGPKLVKDFTKGKKTPSIKGGYFEGKFLTKEQTIMLASTPPREVLLTQIAFCLNDPPRKLAVVLKNTVTKLCWALNALKIEKENIA